MKTTIKAMALLMGTLAASSMPATATVIAGWDTWDSGATPAASVLAEFVTGTAVTTSEGSAWHVNDGRGASADGDWGTFAGPPSASIVGGEMA